MTDFLKNTKIAENDVCIFYVNTWTKGAETWAEKWGFNDIKCLLAEQKSDPEDKEYVLVQNDEFIYVSKKYEDLVAHIDMIAIEDGRTLGGGHVDEMV